MGFQDFSTGWSLLPIFSVAGLVLNVIIFKKGKGAGCLGLFIGLIGFLATATGAWVFGLIVLAGLAFLAFTPNTKPEDPYPTLTDYQRRTATATARSATLYDSEDAPYRADAAIETSEAATPLTQAGAGIAESTDSQLAGESQMPSAAEATQQIADRLGDSYDARVQQIEEDFTTGRIDRATYVQRRRELLEE